MSAPKHEPDVHEVGAGGRVGDSLPPLGKGVERVLDEVRASSPKLDWGRLGGRLFDALDDALDDGRALRVSPERPRSRAAHYATLTAIAAAFTIAVLSPARPQAPARFAPSGMRTWPAVMMDGRAIPVGAELRAGSAGAFVVSADRLRMRLSANARARLLDGGERIHFALDEGTVAAEVMPVGGGEPLAVDVGATRVAVHGTRLFVSASASARSGVQVAVAEGSAVVGYARGQGKTEGAVVIAGALVRLAHDRAVVTYDPHEATRLVDDALSSPVQPPAPPTNASDPTNRLWSQGPIASTKKGGAPLPPAPIEPPASPANTVNTTNAITTGTPPAGTAGLADAQLAPALARLRAGVRACFAPPTAGRAYTFASNVTFTIGTAGHVTEASFDPPPSPEHRACVESAVFGVKFDSASVPTHVRQTVTSSASR